MYKQRKYRLLNLDTGEEALLNGKGTNYIPRNWDESDYTIKRSTKTLSTTKTASDNLEFTGYGATFLRNMFEARGVEAKCLFQEFRSNPRTDKQESYDISLFDFSTYKDEITFIKIQFNSGSLASLIKAKQSDKFELDRTTDINGNDIGELTRTEYANINRPLFLFSKLQTLEENNKSGLLNTVGEDSSNGISFTFPLSIISESDDNIVTSFPYLKDIGAGSGLFSGLFYDKTEVDRVLDISFNASYILQYDAITNDEFALDLCRYDDNLNVIERIRLNELLNLNGQSSISLTASYVNKTFNLLKDESLGIQWFCKDINQLHGIAFVISELESEITITEYSLRTDLPRRSECILKKDAGNRMLKILTGEDGRYISDYYTNSDFKLSAITSGEVIRGFLDRSITTSIKDFLKNSLCQDAMGYNVEVVGGKEVLVHEPLKDYFFRPETVIKIPEQVKVTSRYPANEFIYNTIKSGYKKPSGDNLYEEVNGLNEYNTTNEYITPITKVIQDYNIESPYRADSEGKELTVRKSIKVAPTEDYRTDKNIFNLDLKNVGTSVLEERVWQDDYEEEPKNVFSPETITGLRNTPYRNMERHFWILKSGLTKERSKYIRYSSTRGNSDLITKKAGEDEKKENGNYLIDSIENPIFVAEWIEFEYPFDFDLLKLVNEKTNVNGRDIPNTYFQVEFINEYNKKERGYIFELKPNGVGKWKLLKAL